MIVFICGCDFVGMGIDGYKWGFGWFSWLWWCCIDEVIVLVGVIVFVNVLLMMMLGGE